MPAPEALAFDMYGTLVDPIRIDKGLERYLPDDPTRVAALWRQKQLEYTFRLTAMERYVDFDATTPRLVPPEDLDRGRESRIMTPAPNGKGEP